VQVPPTRIEFSAEDRAEILRRIDECLSSGQVSQGRNVREFEDGFARFVGVRHAVAVSSGGAALEIGMRLLGVTGKDVLVPTNTFVATAGAVRMAGGRVRLVDADAKTFAVSRSALEAALTPETAGVVLVHVGGIVTPEADAIRQWCESRGLWLFEDAAHAHGSAIDGRMAGRLGLAAAYSFFATKVMTSGEGGMLVTDSDELAKRARGLRDYGKPEPWVSFHTELGSNWRMAEFCAAVGLVHLRRLPEFVQWRDRVAGQYTGWLRDVPEVTPILPVDRSSWYKYIVLLPAWADREKVKAAMKASGVSLAGGVYDVPLHRQPVFEGTGGEFPVADDICRRHICLPIYFGMSDPEARYVIETLRRTIRDREVRA